MDRLTRRQIEQHCLVLRDALGEIFPSLDDPSREYYWELLDEVGKMALQSLSQEAVRDEALEEAAKVCDRLALLTGRVCADEIRTLKREPNAATQAGQEFSSAPSHEGHAAGPAPAAPDVASMVKRIEFIRSYASAHIAAEDQNAMRDACALIARLGQGWIPVSERLPEPQKMILMHIPNSHRGPVGYGFLDFATRKFMVGVSSSSHWMTCDGQDTVTHWMPLPLPPGASDE